MKGEGDMPKQTGAEIKKNLNGLKSSLQEFASQIRDKRKRKLEMAKKIADEDRKVETEYNNWLNKLRPKAEKSARVIFSWIEDLLKSKELKELVVEYRDIMESIPISENIIYKDPITHEAEGDKSFSLDFAGNLYVHHNVKYGKSYEIKNVDDMMREVDLPVIIKMADTIKSKSIWSIMKKEIKEELKRYEDWD